MMNMSLNTQIKQKKEREEKQDKKEIIVRNNTSVSLINDSSCLVVMGVELAF